MDIIFEQTFKTIKELAPRYFYTNQLTSDMDIYA